MRVDTGADSPRLQAVLRDLFALSAIPAVWVGREPTAVAAGLADALVELLQLDFAFVRLPDPAGEGALEVTRGAAWNGFPGWLERHQAGGDRFPAKAVVSDVGDDSGMRRGVVVPIGVGGERGLVAAASERADFPTDAERVLISLAANHAATAFENALLIRERKRAAEELGRARDELERKVAERTAEIGQLAEEQAALRRVATLVAQNVQPAEIFAAVSREVGRLIGSDMAGVLRFEEEGPAVVVVGVANADDVSPGMRWELLEEMASVEVFRTRRSARADGGPLAGTLTETLARRGVASTVASPIVVEGRLWGVVAVSSREMLPGDTEARLEKFTELVGTAIANAEGKSELAASRRRIVAASDEARRRLERNLHDGAQQQLVWLQFQLRDLEAAIASNEDVDARLERIAGGLTEALESLVEIGRGIHPAILSEGGLGPALQALARRSSVPVELEEAVDGRLPEQVEVAAYYVVSEALTNAAKHARASVVRVAVAVEEGAVRVSMRDDGRGGADARRGSGLVGLQDRVEAVGGTIEIDSPHGGGTSLVVVLPLEPEPLSGEPTPDIPAA